MNNPIIVFDPGHGGDDTGAAANGVVESVWVREFGDALADDLYGNPDFDFFYMDDPDGLTLRERGEESKYYKQLFNADHALILVTHVNAGPDSLRGFMTFTHADSPGYMAEVGEVMTRSAPAPFYVPNRKNYTCSPEAEGSQKWLQRPLNTLKHHVEHADPILLECFYCTRPDEAKAAQSYNVQQQLVATVRAGIYHWLSSLS